MRFLLPILLSVSLFRASAFSQSPETERYKSVQIDDKGRLNLGMETGAEKPAPRLKGQVRFEEAAISSDRKTVGWLVDYPDPSVTYYRGATIPGSLVLYRDGRILHVFTTEQIFWDWSFVDGGAQVAYCTGPTHGGAAECVLRGVESGAVVARWPVVQDAEGPAWAKNLRH